MGQGIHPTCACGGAWVAGPVLYFQRSSGGGHRAPQQGKDRNSRGAGDEDWRYLEAALGLRARSRPQPGRNLGAGLEERNPDVASLEQRDERFGVAAVARLDQELDHRRLDRGSTEYPLVLDLDDVAASFSD